MDLRRVGDAVIAAMNEDPDIQVLAFLLLIRLVRLKPDVVFDSAYHL